MLRLCVTTCFAVVHGVATWAQDNTSGWSSEPMLEAGARALAGELRDDDPTPDNLRHMAQATFAAMYPHQWQPIETAPMDRKILLGRADERGFEIALGQWEVTDDWPYDGGRWSVSYLWQADPTHWLDVPPPPE